MVADKLGAIHMRLARGRGVRSAYHRVRSLARLGEWTRRRSLARGVSVPAGWTIREEDGFHVLPPWTLPSLEPMVRAAAALRRATDLAPLWDASGGRNLLRVDIEPHLGEHAEFLAPALDPNVLRSVSQYLGSVPILRKIQLWVSPFAERAPDGRCLEHRYHCDWADLRQVRMLVFVDDVTPDHGPLTMIPSGLSADVRRAAGYSFGRESCTISDDRLDALVPQDAAQQLTGPAGTIALADTCRCFHQGSRVLRPGLERLMVMFQFLTAPGFKVPGAFMRKTPFAHFATPGHSAAQRLVLGAD